MSIDKDKNRTVINGESFTNAAASALVSSAYPMGLFCCNMAGTFARPSVMKLYAMKIYHAGVLQRDFIPCRTQEGEIGLYDLVEGQFYANSGTGAFIPG